MKKILLSFLFAAMFGIITPILLITCSSDNDETVVETTESTENVDRTKYLNDDYWQFTSYDIYENGIHYKVFRSGSNSIEVINVTLDSLKIEQLKN